MSLQDQLDGLLNFLQEARLCMTTDHFQGARAHHVSKFDNTLRSLTRISSTEAAGILSKLRSSDCLRPEDVQQLTQPLTIRSAALTHAQASTVQGRTQDYVEFSSFLTQHHWGEINMQGVTDTIVWDILSSFLACLGCQVPSESAIQAFTAAFLLFTQPGAVATWSAARKHEYYLQQKSSLRRRLCHEFSGHPSWQQYPYVSRLATVDALPDQWRQTASPYGHALAFEQAVRRMSSVKALAATIPMRRTNSMLASAAPGVAWLHKT